MIVTIRMNKGTDGPPIIPDAMGRKLLGGASAAVSLAAGAVRHVAWYLSHQVSGRAREDPRPGDEAHQGENARSGD
jgi:hypothetical protein